jgi:uncharacterized protein (TIGR03435 family)
MKNSYIGMAALAALFVIGGFAQSVGAGTSAAINSPLPEASNPSFSVASVKPVSTCDAQGIRHELGPHSPDRISLNCYSIDDLIQLSYVTFATSKPTLAQLKIEGPPLISNQRYAITAKADSPVGLAQMCGPMLRNLLGQRFQLKVRREQRSSTVYALKIAPGGLKIAPAREGSCTPIDLDSPIPPPEYCGKQSLQMVGSSGQKRLRLAGTSITMTELSGLLALQMRQAIIDETALKSRFDFNIEFSVNPNSTDLYPNVFEALAAIGLKLETSKGLVDVLVVESVSELKGN